MIRDPREIRQQFRERLPALAVLIEFEMSTGEPHFAADEGETFPGEKRVGAFGDEEAALVEARRLEAEARRLVNPFKCGLTWSDRSHLPEAVFSDFLRDGGVEPPAPKARSKKKPPTPPDWAAWWQKSQKIRSQSQNWSY